jgi:hypothetical protein
MAIGSPPIGMRRKQKNCPTVPGSTQKKITNVAPHTAIEHAQSARRVERSAREVVGDMCSSWQAEGRVLLCSFSGLDVRADSVPTVACKGIHVWMGRK